MPDQNVSVIASLVPARSVAEENSEGSFWSILDALPLDNLLVQLLIVVAVVTVVSKLPVFQINASLAERNASKSRRLVSAVARIDALCERAEELHRLKKALQDDVLALRKENTNLSARLKAKHDQVTVAETMLENLKLCLRKREKEGAAKVPKGELQRAPRHASYLRRMLYLPSKYQCHVEL